MAVTGSRGNGMKAMLRLSGAFASCFYGNRVFRALHAVSTIASAARQVASSLPLWNFPCFGARKKII